MDYKSRSKVFILSWFIEYKEYEYAANSLQEELETYKAKYKASQKEVEQLKKLLSKVADNTVPKGKFWVNYSIRINKAKRVEQRS